MSVIADVRCYRYRIPFRRPFATAHGSLSAREGAIVEIVVANGISGLGEIAPLPEFSGGTLSKALASLSSCSTRLCGRQLDEALQELPGEGMSASTAYALECALLDTAGQSERRSVAELLAGPGILPRASINVNAVIGATSLEETIQQVRAAIAAGFGCVKLKVGRNERLDLERIAAVRAELGPALHLRLDANEAWSFEQAYSLLKQCERFAIQYVEQPLPATDLAGMQRLRQLVAIPLAADEALHDLASARRILAERAADVLILKPQLMGGLRLAQQVIREAAEQGVQSVITSTIESGIGLVAALHLAAATPLITLECGLATLDLLVDDLLDHPLSLRDGLLAVPTGPGLGIHLDCQALATYTYR